MKNEDVRLVAIWNALDRDWMILQMILQTTETHPIPSNTVALFTQYPTNEGFIQLQPYSKRKKGRHLDGVSAENLGQEESPSPHGDMEIPTWILRR